MTSVPTRFAAGVSAVVLTLGSVVWAQSPTVADFAGNGRSVQATPTMPLSADSPTQLSLGNPFAVEVTDVFVYLSTVDDSRLWRVDRSTNAIECIAGTGGKAGFSGDTGSAQAAEFNWPHEVRVDQRGDLFIADTRNHAIRRIDQATGLVTTLAGSGQAGFRGDGLSGSEVQFNQPHSILLDGKGGVLVADTLNHRLRRIDLNSGVTTTIAGTGQRKLPVEGEPASQQPLFGPRTMALDEANLWIVLREGNSIWRMDRAGGTIHRVAGTGAKGYSGDGGDPLEATFRGPKGLAIDSEGRLLVVDTENHAIRRIDLRLNRIDTVLGGNVAKQTTKLKRPHGIAATADGGFLVADSENHRVVAFRDGSGSN
ncbi:MAG: hypothetical protein AAGA03_10935 [Planctomycetota bacterium]